MTSELIEFHSFNTIVVVEKTKINYPDGYLLTYKITFKITSQFRPNFTISAKFHSFSKPGILGISGIPEIPGILGIPGMRTVSQILRCFFGGRFPNINQCH